jgi:hypothetical protein
MAEWTSGVIRDDFVLPAREQRRDFIFAILSLRANVGTAARLVALTGRGIRAVTFDGESSRFVRPSLLDQLPAVSPKSIDRFAPVMGAAWRWARYQMSSATSAGCANLAAAP